MNEKTSLQDLAALVADKSGIAIKDVEYFLRELIETIQQALLNDETVRIKNLGTFKRLTVSARESVDVTTGNRVVIPAHYKVNFIPDNNLAQAINEPFAPFDPVELDTTSDEASEPKEPKINTVNEEYRSERRSIPVEPPRRSIPVEPPKMAQQTPPPPYPPQHTHRSKKRRPPKWLGSLIFIIIVAVLGLLAVGLFFGDWFDLHSSPASKSKGQPQKETVMQVEESTTREDMEEENLEDEDIVDENIIDDDFVDEDILDEDILEDDTVEADSISIEKEDTAKPPVKNEEKKTSEERAVKPTVGEPSAPAKQYTLQRGDRLTTIALNEYGHKVFWVYLYEENQTQIKNPDNIPAGLTITIPPASKYGIDKNNPESVQKATALQQKIMQQYSRQQYNQQQYNQQQQDWQQQDWQQQDWQQPNSQQSNRQQPNKQQQDWQRQDWQNWTEQEWQQFMDSFPH